jgi:hypothetical protein
MKLETALALQKQLNKEAAGLRQLLEQLERPEVGATPAGMKSALSIVARSLLRVSQAAIDITRAEVEPPSGNPFDQFSRMFGK